MAVSGQGGHEKWSGRAVFLMASVGFAVGLGNIWKFPYLVGENGGGAFVIVYLACAFVIGVPLLMAEIMLGRRGKLSPPGSMAAVAVEAGASPKWRWVGGMAILAVFMIVSYYVVIAGWTVDYFFRSAIGEFTGISGSDAPEKFDSLLASPGRLIFWQTVVLVLTVVILRRGIKDGLEKAVNFMMPTLFVLLIVMVGYGAVAGDFTTALTFLFQPDFSKITPAVVVIAMGQAFFSIGIAMGAMMTFGAYLPKNISITSSAIIIVLADTLVAILAGAAIFPMVFQYGLEPGQGEGLIFATLPIAFGQMPGGQFFGSLFFLLLIFAALTSCIACLEPCVAWAEEHKGVPRKKAALWMGVSAWIVGMLSVFSFNKWSGFFPLDFIPIFHGKTFFGVIDYISANIFLPVGGLLMAILVGWIVKRDTSLEELGLKDSTGFKLWYFLVKYIAPLAIIGIFVSGFIAT